MTFESIIKASGLNPQNYPETSALFVQVLDRKGREINCEELTFVEPLFAKNSQALKVFDEYIKRIEVGISDKPKIVQFLNDCIIVKSIHGVIPQVFMRE